MDKVYALILAVENYVVRGEGEVTVILSLKEKRKEKQIKYERTLLRELSIAKIKQSMERIFASSQASKFISVHSGIEGACFEVAIEAFLLGANYSRFGYYGEPIEVVRERCKEQEQHMIDTLFHFFLFCVKGEEELFEHEFDRICERFIQYWWLEGYNKGKIRHKLRLR